MKLYQIIQTFQSKTKNGDIFLTNNVIPIMRYYLYGIGTTCIILCITLLVIAFTCFTVGDSYHSTSMGFVLILFVLGCGAIISAYAMGVKEKYEKEKPTTITQIDNPLNMKQQ